MDPVRIPPLADDELSDAARAALSPMLEEGRAWNVFRTLAHHPDLTRRWMVFSNHVLLKSTLPARERELAILRVGWLRQAEYEWAQHAVIGAQAGLTPEEIEAVKVGPDAFDGLERLVVAATDQLHHDTRIDDETWAGLLGYWDERQCMDLVFTVGQYTMVCMALRTFGVPLDDFLEGW